MRVRFIVGLSVGLLLVGAVGLRAEDAYFDSNGVKLHYTVQGQGEPVVLVHGFAANLQMNWVLPGVVKELAKDYRVIALDNRGHGFSGKPHDPKQYGKEMVEDVVRLLDHLKIKKAHVVGYSMGAMITNKLIVTHPDRLLSATLGGGAATSQEGDEAFIKELTEALENGKGIAPVLERLQPPDKPKQTAEQLQFRAKTVMAFNDANALAALVRSWTDLRVKEDELKANKIPTLALIGSRDTLKPRVDALKGHMPNLEIIVLDGADHMDSVFRPDFINPLKKFLAAHGTSKAKAKEKVLEPVGK